MVCENDGAGLYIARRASCNAPACMPACMCAAQMNALEEHTRGQLESSQAAYQELMQGAQVSSKGRGTRG